ncbi:MAG TPA: DNA ligase D [Flavisolibacter sp.]|nr:DNA ligase D [Flavisolibacter sp.]
MAKRKQNFVPDKFVRSILKKAKAAPIPANIEPMLATLVSEPVEEKGWLYEMKWDGYRALAYLNKGNVNLCSRNNKSFNEKFYPIHQAMSQWNIDVVVDGEIVVVNEHGVPDFGALQVWRSEDDGQVLYYLFDILWLNGVSVTHLPLEERRELLRHIIPDNIPHLRISETMEDGGTKAFELAAQLQLEGVMAKKSGSTYNTGQRTKDWLKIKTEKRQEFIIGGYTINEGTNKLFSALLLGMMEGGKFEFVTPVGTGFNRKMQEEILKKLEPYETKSCPFAAVPEYNKPSRFRPNPPKADVVWVKPKIVAEISYREMTSSGAIRQPSFKGLREDKRPSEIVREIPVDTNALVHDHKLVNEKVIAAPPKKERKTLLNPKEESQTRPIGGHDLRFTNLSKVFWPKERLTKRDMINYYYQAAPFMLPYMKDRPQTLNRHPHGIEGESFYQKDVKGKAPEWIETYPYFSYADHREKEFLLCTNEASLLYIASLGCIEMNPWHSRAGAPDNPDWCIIDLDPDKNSFNQVIQAARVTKEVLDAAGVASYPKTSGSTGLHIYIPLGAKYSYHDSKEFGRRIAKIVHAELPQFTSIERKTADRNGNMYIDFLQNRPQATVAAPYSLRPKPGAPVSMPLHWEEVKKGLKITDFNMNNAIARMKKEGDIFKGVLGKGINMDRAIKKMEALFGMVLRKVA